MKKFFLMVGRVCLSAFFIALVIYQILNWDEVHHSLVRALSDWVDHPSLPDQIQRIFHLLLSYSSLIVLLGAIFAGLGGLLVFLGIKVQLGSAFLILFLIAMTLIMHAFWLYDGVVHEEQLNIFMRNVSILGGLFILAASSPGGE